MILLYANLPKQAVLIASQRERSPLVTSPKKKDPFYVVVVVVVKVVKVVEQRARYTMEITFFGFCSNHLHEGSGGAPRKCPMRRGASVSPRVTIYKKKSTFF